MNSLESLLTTPNLLVAGLAILSILLLLAIVRGRNSKSQKAKEWEIQTGTWGISDDPWDTPPQTTVPPPPVAPLQTDSLFDAADRIERQDIGREQYVSQRPVMNPIRTPVDETLLNDLNVGNPQKKSETGIDTSFLDDLL